MAEPSLVRFRRAVAAGYAELESRRQEVNDLNVFPVADGDTGDNMAMTMKAVLDELDSLNGQELDEVGRTEVVHAVARGSLLGARGNSGVILSQIVRGAAEELASRPGELIDPVLVSAALARAADAAYESVRNPAEGTMLSAVRAMAHRVARDLAHMDQQRLGPEVDPVDQDRLLADVLERALAAGKEAVEKGPEQLQALRDAGVVDAGAYGLTAIVAGVVAALRGAAAPALEHHAPPSAGTPPHLPEHESSDYRYCTNFAVIGESLTGSAFVPKLEELGDCVLVVGDERTLRIHLHTDKPERATALFDGRGEVSRVDVADMREQAMQRAIRIGSGRGTTDAKTACGAVAVANGSGLVRMYEDLGAAVVDGGRTLNPSTYELLAAIHATGAQELILLPNSPNVVMAAERAAELSEKHVRVAPIHAPQAGLAALLAFDPRKGVADNLAALMRVAARIRVGGIATAAREDPDSRFRAGEALGYVEDALTAWGPVDAVLQATLAELCQRCEIVTAIAGAESPLDRAEVEALMPAGVELDYHVGDQPAWLWLLWAE